MRIAKLKSVYNSLIIGPRGLQCKNNLMLCKKKKQKKNNLKLLITHLFLVLVFWDVKLTCRKSWTGSLLMWSGLTLSPYLFTYSHKSFSISYKIENCRDSLFLCTKTFCLVSIFKRPARDACLYLGDRGERVGPPAPAFSIAYSSATTGQILFKISTCMQ